MFLQNQEWEREIPYLVNNQLKYCNVHAFSVENEEHRNLIYIAMDDITENKRREIELKEVKERLELAVEGGNIGVWDWNYDEEFIHYNKKWAQMLEYKVFELDNNLDTWLDLIHPDELSGLYNRRYFNEELKQLYISRKYPISIIVEDMSEPLPPNKIFGRSFLSTFLIN